MFTEALELGLTAWEQRSKLAELVSELVATVKRGRVQIAVVGLGGTGKTTLARLLAGTLDAGATATSGYVKSLHTEKSSVGGLMRCTLVVPPGQEHLARGSMIDVYKGIRSGESWCVIHAVSYGHNALEPDVRLEAVDSWKRRG